MLYTDCQSGRTAAIARHVSFSQIICCLKRRSDTSVKSTCFCWLRKMLLHSQKSAGMFLLSETFKGKTIRPIYTTLLFFFSPCIILKYSLYVIINFDIINLYTSVSKSKTADGHTSRWTKLFMRLTTERPHKIRQTFRLNAACTNNAYKFRRNIYATVHCDRCTVALLNVAKKTMLDKTAQTAVSYEVSSGHAMVAALGRGELNGCLMRYHNSGLQ